MIKKFQKCLVLLHVCITFVVFLLHYNLVVDKGLIDIFPRRRPHLSNNIQLTSFIISFDVDAESDTNTTVILIKPVDDVTSVSEFTPWP